LFKVALSLGLGEVGLDRDGPVRCLRSNRYSGSRVQAEAPELSLEIRYSRMPVMKLAMVPVALLTIIENLPADKNQSKDSVQNAQGSNIV
jgi:hypothetical protein